MASSSFTASHYRQPPRSSVTRFHEIRPEVREIVIEMGAGDQVGQGSGSSTVDHSTLSKLVKEKKSDLLDRLGRVEGIAASLKTDLEGGIGGDIEDISWRTKAFGSNSYAKPPGKGWFCFVWEALVDPTILILLVCAALLLGFGIKVYGSEDGWYDGASILVAVFFIVSVSAASNFRQNKQLDKLSKISNNILVKVVRTGIQQKISISDIVVGDVVSLSIGDQIPADGLFVGGYSLRVDESSMTGENDLVEVDKDQNPFLFSGTMVADGCAKMMVTCVGMNTTKKFIEQTPLQARLKKLTLLLGKFGLVVGFLVLAALLVQYFIEDTTDENGNKGFSGSKTKVDDVINTVVGIITTAVTVVVVAIPGGLLLATTLIHAYGMKEMRAHHALLRKLSAFERMGSATTICTAIPALLQNRMEVTKSVVGAESMERRSYTSIAANVLQLLLQGIILARGSVHNLFSVAPMDDAIHSWAVMKLNMDMDNSTQGLSILDVEASSPEKMSVGLSVERQQDNTNMIHVHWRGDFERILSSCSSYYDNSGQAKVLDDEQRAAFRQTAHGSLRCIAFAHKYLSKEEYKNERVHRKVPDKDLILLGFVGLKASCHPGMKQAVENFQLAGVAVKMITGENVSTAKAIAMECGILDNDESIVTGEEFRGYQDHVRMQRADNIRLMARSSPFDKLLMVQCLKRKGHVVAVTGDGTNDAPALREADIGLSMGIQGTEVEKESSDVIILDDNFASVVTVLRWGRFVYNNIQKFIQFQLTVNVAAMAINYVAAVSTGEIPLTPAQLLWVNLIMDTLGALALATGNPTDELMNKPPIGQSDPLITNIMWRSIVGLASYQIAVILALEFKGKSIFGNDGNIVDTLIFTTFVLLQVFNQFNSRELEGKNIFKGIHKNKLFLGITGITIVLQVIMVELLNKFAHTERLDWKQWGACIGIAAFSWLIGWLIKFLPVPKKPILHSLIK
ncbi:calcium-transporting ATPase 12, plasma membrane-type-like [Sesamum indicum]|uniref:Calcium-transporting ATPase n=1 Tax=Sesamum indicum TaxID=4182 RepID=A0A6I9TVI8_SESIN|nr:calcium-transporting ATPase 12, plasma membrane-type-like [Sesamum indicum]XP_011091072.1 calcium-transporting ATPase 12, plasma membrane-type-like [Sesamum indicum]XP_011091073.1 calcium-transporting ATPase 12, plasma membrane-type-like [Sesamum indicum]